MMRWIIYLGYFTFLVGLGGIVYGIWGVYEQHRKITTFQPVDAIVLSNRIDEKKAKYAVQYVPVVQYEYTVGQRRYVSTTTMPTESRGPKKWADQVLGRYPLGAQVQAQVDPHDPSDSFLLPKYGPSPYLAILISVVIVGFGIGVVHEQKMMCDDPPVPQAGGGGALLTPKHDHRGLARLLGVLASIGLLIGTPASLHYFSVSTPPVDGIFCFFTFMYNAAGLVMIAWGLHSHWTKGGFRAAELSIDKAQPVIGQPFNIMLSQPVRFDGTVHWMTLRLVCHAKKNVWFDISQSNGDAVLYERTVTLFRNHSVQASDILRTQAAFTLPGALPHSTPANDKSKVRIVWTLELKGQANRLRSLSNEYILEVVSQSPVLPWSSAYN